MLSRVANSIYWLSRYVERAENVARFLEVNFHLSLGKSGPIPEQWMPLVCVSGDEQRFRELYHDATQENVVRFLALDRRNPNSIASSVQRARENALEAREVIPAGIWEQINKFYFLVQPVADSGDLADPTRFCEQVRLASHVIDGMCDSSMLHGEQWHFTRLGRLLERADKTSRIVDAQYYILLPEPRDVGSAVDVVRWCSLLKSATGLSSYRQRYGAIVPSSVAEFLLLDREFPRSLHFCLIHALASLNAITGSAADTYRCRSEQTLGRLRADFDYASIDDIIGQGIHEFVEAFQQRLNEVGEAVHGDLFTQHRRVPSPRGIRLDSNSPSPIRPEAWTSRRKRIHHVASS